MIFQKSDIQKIKAKLASFNTNAVGLAGAQPYGFKSILWKTLFLN